MDCNYKLKDKIADDVKSYVEMRIDSVKLAIVEGLSTIVGKGIGFIIFLFLCHTALLLFVGAMTYGLGLMIGSMVWAAVIMGCLLLLIGILIFMKPTLFINRMVRIFSNMFFSSRKNNDYE